MEHIKKISAILIAALLMQIVFITAYANNYSITVQNTNTSISINNNTYIAYLLFEAVENTDGAYIFNPSTCLAVSYTPTGGSSLSGTELLNWLSSPDRTTAQLHDFSTNIHNDYIDINPAPTPSASATATGEQATIPLTLAGYYIVTGGGERVDNHSTITALSSLSVVNPTSTINPKFDAPSLKKTVYHENTDIFAGYSDHTIGDDVEYKIETTVPATTGYVDYNYIISDTLDSSLTFNNDLILSAQTAAGTNTIAPDYYTLTVYFAPNNGFSLDIDILSLLDDGLISTADTLIVSFTAILNENAVVNPNGTNDNNAFLSYSNNPQNLSSTGNTPTITTKSSTFQIHIAKTDSDGHQLNGAEFVMTLDSQLITDAYGNPTNAIDFIKNSDTDYTIAPSEYSGTTTTTLVAGSINILGLNSDTTYYLHEIKSPDGFAKSTVPTYFSIQAEYNENTAELLQGYPNILVNNSTTPVAPSIDLINHTNHILPQTGSNSNFILIISGILFLVIGLFVLAFTLKGTKNAKP